MPQLMTARRAIFSASRHAGHVARECLVRLHDRVGEFELD